LYSPGPVAYFADEDDVSGNQNTCYWPLHTINNSRFAEFLPLIYPPELEVKETTDTASAASFLDLYLEFDDSGQLSTKIYDKRDDFNFKIINFPNMCRFSLYENASLIIFSAETEYISTRY
jgi:hypothetical protein